jgi:hypothetical protein
MLVAFHGSMSYERTQKSVKKLALHLCEGDALTAFREAKMRQLY